MSFIKSMQKRYTTKMYDPTKKIDADKIEELKEVLRMSPSSVNSQPWEFTFVSDGETKAKLAKASYFNEEKVMNCDTLLVFSRVENIDFFEADLAERLPEPAMAYYNNFVKPQSAEQKKAWFEKQVYLSLGVFLAACANMNIDSTPMEGIEHAKYDQILEAKDYTALVAVAIGYRSPEDFNQVEKKAKSRKAVEQVVRIV